MRLLSSQATFFYKRLFPAAWFLFSAIFAVIALWVAISTTREALLGLIVPLILGIIGYFMFVKLGLTDFVDEVWIDDDNLIVKNGSHSDYIALSNIASIRYLWFTNPSRVTLNLKRASAFGSRVTFLAPVRYSLAKPVEVQALLERTRHTRDK
jgi:hypothetical protein